MNLYFDRQGQPIDQETMSRLWADFSYKVVEQTTLPNGHFVSTVWLGIDHAFFDGPPVLFETMVFPIPTAWSDELDCRRYHTEDEAKAGHVVSCRFWRVRPNRRVKWRVLKKKTSRAVRTQRIAMKRERAKFYRWRKAC